MPETLFGPCVVFPLYDGIGHDGGVVVSLGGADVPHIGPQLPVDVVRTTLQQRELNICQRCLCPVSDDVPIADVFQGMRRGRGGSGILVK